MTQAASGPGGALERLLKRLKERMLSSEIKELEGAEEYENPNHDATGRMYS